MEKGKAKVGEEAFEGEDQQQLEEYLPAYLKKVEDEVDTPETTIEELEEISLDENDPDKKVLICKPREICTPKILNDVINLN